MGWLKPPTRWGVCVFFLLDFRIHFCSLESAILFFPRILAKDAQQLWVFWVVCQHPQMESWNPGILESPSWTQVFQGFNLGIPFLSFKRALKFGSGGSGGFFGWNMGLVGFTQNRLASHHQPFCWLLPGGVQLGRKWSQKTQGNRGCSDGRRDPRCVGSWQLVDFFATAHPELSSFCKDVYKPKFYRKTLSSPPAMTCDMWHATMVGCWLKL